MGRAAIKILAIDDHADNLIVLRAVLHERLPEAELVCADSGYTGLAKAVEHQPDVVLLDIVMPGMDGYSVCRQLKANPRTQDIPILFLTALRTDRESRVKALECGAEGFLCKPFDEVELTAQIRAMAKIRAASQMRAQEKDRLAALVVERTMALEQELAERKRAEEKVRAQAELLEMAQDAISVRDMQGRATYWNRSCERVTGWSANEALGRHVPELLRLDPAFFRQAHKTLLADGHWNGEYNLVNKAGQTVPVMSRWTLVRDEQANPVSVLVISTDVTEQKRLEAQFLRSQRLEGIGALASGIAHDLNNILAPILMTASLLRETVREPDTLAMLDTVEHSAKRGADIIKQLLTFARGKPGSSVPLPMRHLLQDMAKLVRETFPRDISAVVDTPKDLWTIMGDATQIHQSLMNLCVNARDAMPDGGTLTLAARNTVFEHQPAAEFPEAKSGPYVRVSISDTGTGITPENFDHIFDPFFTTKDIGKGTGLGLATVLGIVKGHKGFIRVESVAGEGTTFALYFPASPQAQTTSNQHLAPQAPMGHGEVILVVDDETSVRTSVKRNLESKGYQILTAGNGSEGLEVFSKHSSEIQAVLTDMMMPNMSGPAMISVLRETRPDLVIVGMTGLAESAGVKGLDSINVTALLTKPFTRDELLTVLHAALQPRYSVAEKCGA